MGNFFAGLKCRHIDRADVLLVMTLAAAATGPATVTRAAPNVASVPDFSGIWAHPALGFESPVSGPGPVRNKSRLPSGTGNFDQLVGDYTNPILKPEAAEIVKKFGEISLSGRAFPDPDNQCLVNPVPYIFWNFDIQLLQQRDKVTIIYQHDDDHREVRLNQRHPAKVIPSIHGDSVGHYEGDTLVIDTVGVKVGRYAMVDRFGTPFTQALHVVERYRLLDYEAAKEAEDRAEREWPRVGDNITLQIPRCSAECTSGLGQRPGEVGRILPQALGIIGRQLFRVFAALKRIDLPGLRAIVRLHLSQTLQGGFVAY